MSQSLLPASSDLSILDSVADAALPPTSFVRYLAFRDALVADGQDAERIAETLSLFVWALCDGRSANGVH